MFGSSFREPEGCDLGKDVRVGRPLIFLGQDDRDHAERSALARLANPAEHGGWPAGQSGSILVNRLIGPVCRVGEHVGPVPSHLAVVAIFAGVCEKDATGIVLGRLWLARST